MDFIRRLFDRLWRFAVLVVQLVATTVMLAVGLSYWHWTSIKNLAFRESLFCHAQTIRQSKWPLNDKELLLDRLDELMDELQEDRTVGVLRWVEFHEAIEPLLKNGIAGDKVQLVEREIDGLKRELLVPNSATEP